MKTIKYHWTGEYRPPKEREWYLIGSELRRAGNEIYSKCYFILRREEVEVDENTKESLQRDLERIEAIAACIVRLGAENDLAKDVLTDIHDIAINYDGYEKAEDLKGLVDELKGMATKYLANLKPTERSGGMSEEKCPYCGKVITKDQQSISIDGAGKKVSLHMDCFPKACNKMIRDFKAGRR